MADISLTQMIEACEYCETYWGDRGNFERGDRLRAAADLLRKVERIQQLAKDQRPLDPDFARIVRDNLDSLYD
jgi:hypothetical protein